MKEIKLSQQGKNKNKYVALVDDKNYNNVNKFKWFIIKGKNTNYAARHIDNSKSIYLHTFIMEPLDGEEIDHIDHNGLNCLESNMRNCTHQENRCNNTPHGKSKYLGVYYLRIRNKYEYITAGIYFNYKRIHLGYFKSEIEAAKAYDKKALELYGEFANLNFK